MNEEGRGLIDENEDFGSPLSSEEELPIEEGSPLDGIEIAEESLGLNVQEPPIVEEVPPITEPQKQEPEKIDGPAIEPQTIAPEPEAVVAEPVMVSEPDKKQDECVCRACREEFKVDKFVLGETKCPACGFTSEVRLVGQEESTVVTVVPPREVWFFRCEQCGIEWENLLNIKDIEKCSLCHQKSNTRIKKMV